MYVHMVARWLNYPLRILASQALPPSRRRSPMGWLEPARSARRTSGGARGLPRQRLGRREHVEVDHADPCGALACEMHRRAARLADNDAIESLPTRNGGCRNVALQQLPCGMMKTEKHRRSLDAHCEREPARHWNWYGL